MTVIACNLREMAADSLVTVTDGRPYHTTKLARLADDSIIGYCGTGYEFIVAWLKAGELAGNEPQHVAGQDYQVLRLRRDGIWTYVNSPIPDRLRERMFAIGSGSNVAMYAMRYLKKTPGVAVRESCKVSDGCGGPVDVLRIKPKGHR